jgi:small subunit ribosomal protein S18
MEAAKRESRRGNEMADETVGKAPESGAAPQGGHDGPPARSGGGRPQGGRPGGGPGGRGKFFRRKKVCKFCTEKVDLVDYKDVRRLRSLVTERGKIIPRRISGSCARHQRQVTHAIKRARTVALLPYMSVD